jgi:hypothetical protein
MPETIGSLFRRIVKVLKTQDDNPNSCLNNPKSEIYNPNYDINNPCSWINNQNSQINDASNNQNNKELRRNALRELIKMYLSDCLSTEKAETFVTEYIP